jgi:hypothetical protein
VSGGSNGVVAPFDGAIVRARGLTKRYRLGKVAVDALRGVDVAVRPGSNVELCWSLRWAMERKLAWYWCLQTLPETAQFWRFVDGAWVPISTSVPVPGVQAGRTAHVTVVVREQELEMYLDGAFASRAVDDQVPVADTVPGLELNSGRGSGLVRIEGIGIWALPG